MFRLKCRAIVASLWLVGLAVSFARPVDLSAPTGGLGAAGPTGEVTLWREVAAIDFGENLILPLRFKFSSALDTRGVLGEGFWCPLIEARAVTVSEQLMKVNLLCGKARYLRRSPSNPAKFKTYDGEWSGLLTGEDFEFSRSDGWTLRYRQSRLISLHTDTGRDLSWDYRSQTIEIRESGRTILTVNLDVSGHATSFFFQNQRHALSFDRRPRVETLNGQPIVGGVDTALSAWVWPDNHKEIFDFSLSEDRLPKLTHTDRDLKESVYTWDANTRRIRTENGWTYEIAAKVKRSSWPPIYRTNSQHQREGIIPVTGDGIYTVIKSDGTKQITTVFKSPGPLYDKLHKIEKEDGNGKHLVRQNSFDELGKLLRSVDENGIITSYKYSSVGAQSIASISLSSNPALRKTLLEQEQAFLKEISNARFADDRDALLKDLLNFYISKTLQFEKASTLIANMQDSETIFNAKLMLALSNPAKQNPEKRKSLEALIAEFPDKEAYLKALIP